MSTTRRPLATLATVALIGLLGVTGCSNDATETDGGTSTGQDSVRQQALKFSACMRDNGVGDFPDPDASGEMTIDGVLNGSSLDPDTAGWKQAIAACKDLQPAGFTGRKRSAEQQEAALAFAHCMRENGIEDFPDPVEGGPLIDTNRIPSAAGRGALEIPGFQTAQEACREPAGRALEGQ
ncbi:MAG: hypothetical protein AB7G37_08440 [Solirubrobacteraceae bacterium]